MAKKTGSSEEQKMYSKLYDIPDKLDNETRKMRAKRIQTSTHRGAQTAKNMKAAGIKLYGYRNSVQEVRARSGKRTTSPPRTGPNSGNAGGQSARYTRLIGGGLNKNGR